MRVVKSFDNSQIPFTPKAPHPPLDTLRPQPRSTLFLPQTIARIITISTPILLALAVVTQVVLGYQFYSLRKEYEITPVKEHLEAVDNRFARMTVILKYLFDKGQKESSSEANSPSPVVAPQGANDLPVARVLAPKLNLRAGPSSTASPLMAVSEGTLLVVEDSSDQSWVRVVAPNGARAYAQRELIEIQSAL